MAAADEEVVGSLDDEPFPDVIRLEVLPSYREDALARLHRAGFSPEVENSSEDHSTFVFRGLSEQDAFRAASLVPREYYAKRGYVGRWRRE